MGTILAMRRIPCGISFGIEASSLLVHLNLGDSISVNGVCLTACAKSEGVFFVEAVEETLSKTNLSSLREGSLVNLERALTLDKRLGGHIVHGHVDGVGEIIQKTQNAQDDSFVLEIALPDSLLKYVVEKGSLAIDGISLTPFEVSDTTLKVAIIPHTAKMTTLQFKRVHDKVNIEADILAKYLEKLVVEYPKKMRSCTLE